MSLLFMDSSTFISVLVDKNVFYLYRQIFELAEKYNSLVFIDESHATGFFGKTGRYDDKVG